MKKLRYILTLIIAMLLTAADAWGAITPTTPSTDANGVYQIGTAEELWGFAQIVNGGNLTACAVLTADIDLGGEANGSFPGIGPHNGSEVAYKGTFDGNGKKITNFYMAPTSNRSGLFSSTYNATIKNFTLSGKIVVSGGPTMVGAVVGDIDPAGANSLIEDVSCSVEISLYSNKATRVGGIAGCITKPNSKINRCRFNGTITAGPAYDGIGGIVGEVRGGIINNSLFDGTITTTATSGLAIGGIVGKVTNNVLSMSSVFSNGTITLVNATNAGAGALVGTSAKTITLSNAFYNLNGVTGTTAAIGTNTATTNGTAEDVTNLNAIYDGTLHFRLGEENWKQDGGYVKGHYPVPGAGGSHNHRYDANGYCIADGEAEPATLNGDYYEIDNQGKLFWFQNQVNVEHHTTYNAKLTADISLGDKEFSGIGSLNYQYAGTFDGDGHTISGFKRTATSGNNHGFFNYTKGATLKKFTLEGAMTFSQTSSSAFNAGVVALATNTTIEDVTSSVNITCTTANQRLVAGIVGRLDNGSINRCRFHGTLNSGASGDQVAGIVASIQNGATITNCLFDGKISCTSTATADKMHIGGIVGFAVGGSLTLSNNLVVGTITLSGSATTTNCGLLYGNLSAVGTTTANTNYYTISGSSISNAGGSIKASQTVTATVIGAETSWTAIRTSLGEQNWVFAENNTPAYPIPGEGTVHEHNYVNGFCGCSTEPYEEPHVVDGVYQIANGGQLFWFATRVNDGRVEKTAYAVLTEDIDLEGTETTPRNFPGIGNSTYKYAGVFNGQYNAITGFNQTTSGNYAGLFNFIEKAVIMNFSLAGTMSVGHNYAGSVVGSAWGVSKINDVTSSVVMTITDANVNTVGGIVGGIGSTSNATPALVVRCRFNGTINAGDAYNTIGGLVGVANSLKIGFCLFDGTITANSTNAGKKIAGIVAGSTTTSTTNTIALYSILSHGTITLDANTSKCGIVYGDVLDCGLLHVDNTYYTTTNTGSLTSVGPAVEATDFVVTHVPTAEMMGSRILGTQLGFDNWYWKTDMPYPLPGELHTCDHSSQDVYGLCSNCSHLSPVVKDAEGAYLIKTASDFGRIRSLLNSDQLHGAITVKMTEDIDMSASPVSYIEPMGTAHNPFTGTFDGQGHSFKGVTIDAPDHDGAGFFGYVKDATIKNLNFKKGNDTNGSSKGTMTITHGSNMNAPVVGYAMGNTTLEDISCEMDITVTHANASMIGGIVGKTESNKIKLNRCRYNGTITFNSGSDAVGGIIGTSNGVIMQNCLFDGTLSSTSTTISVGGLIGTFTDDNTSISNSLSHGTYTIAAGNTKAGILFGYANGKGITLDKVIYTTSGNLSAIKGTSSTGDVNASLSYPKEMTSEDLKSLALGELGEANWKKETAEAAYPIPGTGGAGHMHALNPNGFCSGNDGYYQSATKDVDGYYAISNAGQLWWIAEQINNESIPRNVKIKLMNDINMEGALHGSFSGICPLGTKTEGGKLIDDWNTAFSGTFDGKGYTISNYYRSITSGVRLGLINSAVDAIIRNFDINGTMTVVGNANTAGSLIGVVVGCARGNTDIDDINSNVTIAASGVRALGGIAGCLENTNGNPNTEINRCRYNGVMTISGNNNAGIGGLVGEMRCAIIRNSLFDGTITTSTDNYKYVGGLVGLVQNINNNEIHRSLMHGTISLQNYTEDKENSGVVSGSKSGMVVGCILRTLYMNKCYHTTTGVTPTTLPVIGPQIETTTTGEGESKVSTDAIVTGMLLGSSTEMTSSSNPAINSEVFRKTLGASNWIIDDKTSNNYPRPKKDPDHEHQYSNGFCTAGDGEYEKPTISGDNTYQIDNGGKLYWFAEHFNAGDIPQDATAEIMKDIDMEGNTYSFPGIGSSSRPFKGTFNGHGYAIRNFYRDIVNSEFTGFINDAYNATIKEFTLSGEIRYNLTSHKSFHGTVVGRAIGENSLIQDVFSYVDADINNKETRVWGGIAGRASGTINRCSYSGTVRKATGNTFMESGQQIGGICANAVNKIVIENCLFDGTIWCHCPEPTMRVSGILASNELNTSVDITIKNCLFNGCLNLVHNYADGEDKKTENGIIAGYWDSGKASLINNVYYLKKCETEMSGLLVGNYATTPKPEDYKVTQIESEPTADGWNEIFKSLDEVSDQNPSGNGNWKYNTDNYPTPHGQVSAKAECAHKHADGTSALNAAGWCTICGNRKNLEQDDEGKYKLETIADLASFRDLVNSGTVADGTVLNAKLTQDIDFSIFPGELGEPIGNTNFNRYLYNFDGQGYSIKNIRVTADQEYVGMFGFAGDETHDCYIHDFTIMGYIDVPYQSSHNDDKPLYAGVVGKMFRGTIENVHSEMIIRNENETEIVLGGILGCAEQVSDSQDYGVTIKKCSYTGAATINGYGYMGGIVGKVGKNTSVDNCLFTGSLDHTPYNGDVNMSQIGGVVGYNESAEFKGVKNTLVAGLLTVDDEREFPDYGTAGNHKNVLCGEDKIITNGPSEAYKAKYSNNFAWEVYDGKIPNNSVVEANYVTKQQFANGEVCAALNGTDSDQPWTQILGYQLGYDTDGDGVLERENADGTKRYDPNSPAEAMPFVGWSREHNGADATPENPKMYRVVKDASNSYTADYYFFDDMGDTTPYPGDAASMKVKSVEYHRNLTGGYHSVCLPFPITQQMASGLGGTLYKYYKVSQETDEGKASSEGGTQKVLFTTVDEVAAGEPCILQCSEQTWDIEDENANVNIFLQQKDGEGNFTAIKSSSGVGLYASHNTIETGWGYWKLEPTGDHFVKTIGRENASDKPSGENIPTDPISHCFPYRAYLKLPAESPSQAPKHYIPVFLDKEESPEIENNSASGDDAFYNLMGQRVNRNAKGIVIRRGMKYLNTQP